MNVKMIASLATPLAVTCLSLGCATEAPPARSAEETAPVSAGCGTAPPVVPGESAAFSMRAGELEREWVLHLPPAYDAGRATPVVVDFHGYTGLAAGEEAYTGLSLHADEHGYAVVYPQGTGFTVDSGQLITSWNDLAGSASTGPEGPVCADTADYYPPPPECGEPRPCVWATCYDDLNFIEQMLDRLEAELCVDLDRVYATGMSNGGMFVHRLGCEMPQRFAAIAPVGGTLARGFNCAPSVPLAMMNIYGSQDGYVSQRGDVSSDGYYYTGAGEVLSKWASRESQACDSESTSYPTSQDGTLGMACVEHDNCATGAEVVHCTWDGAHDWPQDETLKPGNEVIWEFFSKHTRAGYRASQQSRAEQP